MDCKCKNEIEHLESIFKSQKVALINENKLNSHHWKKKKKMNFVLTENYTEIYWPLLRNQLIEWIVVALMSGESIIIYLVTILSEILKNYFFIIKVTHLCFPHPTTETTMTTATTSSNDDDDDDDNE